MNHVYCRTSSNSSAMHELAAQRRPRRTSSPSIRLRIACSRFRRRRAAMRPSWMRSGPGRSCGSSVETRRTSPTIGPGRSESRSISIPTSSRETEGSTRSSPSGSSSNGLSPSASGSGIERLLRNVLERGVGNRVRFGFGVGGHFRGVPIPPPRRRRGRFVRLRPQACGGIEGLEALPAPHPGPGGSELGLGHAEPCPTSGTACVHAFPRWLARPRLGPTRPVRGHRSPFEAPPRHTRRNASISLRCRLEPLMPETRFENSTHLSISGPLKASGGLGAPPAEPIRLRGPRSPARTRVRMPRPVRQPGPRGSRTASTRLRAPRGP